MQFSSIISLAALAMTAVAVPTNPPANSCSNDQSISCCGPQAAVLGVQCVTLALINGQCNAGSSFACCPNSGIQNGLVNIGTVCVPISV